MIECQWLRCFLDHIEVSLEISAPEVLYEKREMWLNEHYHDPSSAYVHTYVSHFVLILFSKCCGVGLISF